MIHRNNETDQPFEAGACQRSPEHPDLTLDLDRVLDSLDAATRDCLIALANRDPLVQVAERHGLSYAAARLRTSEPDAHRFVEVAVRYAANGWPVVPLHAPGASGCTCRRDGCGSPGKHPRTARGLHDTSTDQDRISAWWHRWPNANLGVGTGAVAGLLVLDVDLPDGPSNLARLEAEHTPLPATCEQRTCSGGRQLLFAHPGHPASNRTRLEPGIDVRGDGGSIVVPPSAHASGGRYQWTGRVPPATPPD